MNSDENYFGIYQLRKSPLRLALKQQLAEILFVNPEVSATEASLLVKNYITDSSAEKLVERLNINFGNFIFSKDPQQINRLSILKTQYWLDYFYYPNYEEIKIAARRLKSNEDCVIKNLEIALIESASTSAHVIDYLKKYSKHLRTSNIDSLLDYYLFILAEEEEDEDYGF